ncbi:MAG: SOS response-associated peptidase [Burkholderiales bacterium]
MLPSMCGRYVAPKKQFIAQKWHIRQPGVDELLEMRFNAAPTQLLPVIRSHPQPELVDLRWGLIPSWAKDPAIGAKMINARGETVAEKPSFRAAFRRRRCLVPMAGFYEWQKTASGKVPHYIHLLNEEQFAVAGLWEHWQGGDGVAVESFTIITTGANALMARLHERMPVILPQHLQDAWLDPAYADVAALHAMLLPYPAEEMRAYPVSTRVNSVKNDGPDLIAPAG